MRDDLPTGWEGALNDRSNGRVQVHFLVKSPSLQEHELNVDRFLNANILSQNLLHTFRVRNMSTFERLTSETAAIRRR